MNSISTSIFVIVPTELEIAFKFLSLVENI